MLHSMTIYSYNLHISISFTPSVTFVGSTDNLRSVRVDVPKPAGYAVCDGNVSSYPAGAAAGYCILLVSAAAAASSFFFLLLATRLFHILPYIRF